MGLSRSRERYPEGGAAKGGLVGSDERRTSRISSPSDCRAQARRNRAHGWAVHLRPLLFIRHISTVRFRKESLSRVWRAKLQWEGSPSDSTLALMSLDLTQPGLGPANRHETASNYRKF